MYYNYLPELQGLTQVQQQGLRNQFATQRSGLARQYNRMGMQSSGGLLGAMANLGGQEALGLSDIEIQNMLKNALLGREERLTKEGRDWQKQMAELEFQRQKDLMAYQKELAEQDRIWQVLGGLGGMALSTGLDWLGASQGWNMSPLQQSVYKYYKDNPEMLLKYLSAGGGLR